MLRFPRLWLAGVAVVAAGALATFASSDRTPGPAFAQSTCGDAAFFSEYVEGTSDNKAVEVFNGTGDLIELEGADYSVDVYSNGAVAPTASITLAGVIGSGDVYVLAAQDIAGVTEDQISAALNFNGNDAVVLRHGPDTLDVIGDIGVDPGAEWGAGAESTADNTLRRSSTVSAGRTTSAPDFNTVLPAEWNGYPVDTFAGLGTHVAVCFSGGSDNGSVTTTIEATEAPGPCLLLSTDSIDYGVLAFSSPLTSRSASAEVTVTNCNVEPEDILAQGADATGPSATWTLATPPGSGNMCAGVDSGINRYAHTLDDGVAPLTLALTNANQTYQSATTGGAAVLTATTFHMPCSGSDGAGELMSTSITFTAVTVVLQP